MIFRCGGISDSTIDGIGMSLDIFFQGCSRGCKNCHNLELQDKNGGFDYYTHHIFEHLEKYFGFYQSIVFVGGEPLENDMNAIFHILNFVKNSGLIKVLYTGWVYEDITGFVAKMFDIIIDGPYIEELKTGGFPASSNQNIYIYGKKIELNNNYNRSLMEIFNNAT